MSSPPLYPCVCCFYAIPNVVLPESPPPGTFNICGICGWQDDDWAFRDHERGGGANRESLREARANFEAIRDSGDIAARLAKHNNPPRLLPTENKDVWLIIVAVSLVNGDNPRHTVLSRLSEYQVSVGDVKRYLLDEFFQHPEFLEDTKLSLEQLTERYGPEHAAVTKKYHAEISRGEIWLWDGESEHYLLDNLFPN